MRSMTSKLLDMRECYEPEFSHLWPEIRKAELLMQPWWFRPLYRISKIQGKLDYGHWANEWIYPWAILSADLRSDMRVLDVGSGGSNLPVYISASVLDCCATDPNISRNKQIRDWRRSILSFLGITTFWGMPGRKRKGNLSVKYFPMSIQELSFPDGFFDRVFCLGVLLHVPKTEWSICMEQLSRVLKPGGKLIVALGMSHTDADKRVYEHLIKCCPLQIVGSVDYPVPISDEDKRLRKTLHRYEVVGMVWNKVLR
ncbi:MAG: class I SAM-dependent methyltransferase [Candidatus Scalindua sp.]